MEKLESDGAKGEGMQLSGRADDHARLRRLREHAGRDGVLTAMRKCAEHTRIDAKFGYDTEAARQASDMSDMLDELVALLEPTPCPPAKLTYENARGVADAVEAGQHVGAAERAKGG